MRIKNASFHKIAEMSRQNCRKNRSTITGCSHERFFVAVKSLLKSPLLSRDKIFGIDSPLGVFC